MNRFLSLLVLLSTVTSAFAAKDFSEKKECPSIINGAGSTLLGQFVNHNGGPTFNDSFMVQATQNFSVGTDNEPKLAYNGVNPATGSAFDQDSSAGVRETLANITLFGGTDVFPTAAQDPNNRLLTFPVAVAGIAIAYNLPPNTPQVDFSATVLAQIFSGQVAFWSDLNKPGQPVLPHTAIKVITRADASGSTNDFTTFLNRATGGLWTLFGNGDNSNLTGGFSINEWINAFPPHNGLGVRFAPQATGTTDVLTELASTPGAIAYVGYNNLILSPAFINRTITFGLVNGIAPSPATFTAALSSLKTIPANLHLDTINSPAPAYPIANPTNLVVRSCLQTSCEVRELREFLYYLATIGQDTAVNAGLGALTTPILAQYIKNLSLLRTIEGCVDERVQQCCFTTPNHHHCDKHR